MARIARKKAIQNRLRTPDRLTPRLRTSELQLGPSAGIGPVDADKPLGSALASTHLYRAAC